MPISRPADIVASTSLSSYRMSRKNVTPHVEEDLLLISRQDKKPISGSEGVNGDGHLLEDDALETLSTRHGRKCETGFCEL